MNETEEQREYEEVEKWAQDRPTIEIAARIEELLRTNSYARERLNQPVYGDGEAEGRSSVVLDHSGYNRSGSSNWEHDDTGAKMNYSGMADIALIAQADEKGWEAGYDYPVNEDGGDQ
jgi:hypothetical protein